MPSFAFLRALSFTNSVVFTGLLVAWIAPGLEGATTVCGWAHGCMWIALSVLSIVAVRGRVIPFWLGVVVAVVGGVGPFAGTAGFIAETRRRRRGAGYVES
jgi:hypothetical protein